MLKRSHALTTTYVLKDLLASVVVFLTALPLCMGIALASGAPVEAGLISGVIGGILVGALSGSSYQVSGPAAGLSVLVLEYIHAHGFASLGVILIVVGVLQVLAGWFKFGQIFRAVSPAVVSGMLSGIGILIIASQIYVMLGVAPKGSGLDNVLGLPALLGPLGSCVSGVPLEKVSGGLSLLVGLSTIAVIALWKKLAPGKLGLVPAPLVAIAGATIACAVFNLPVNYVNVPTSIIQSLHLPDFAAAGHLGLLHIMENAIAIALIASAETLLSANAVDRLHRGARCKYDKELLAQGLGNAICGLVGGLPITGVIARSSVNVQAGARTRMSAIFHGIWLFGFITLVPGLVKLVPVSCLAALLLYTGSKLIDLESIRKLWGYGPRLVAIYAATVICIVVTDLLTGVMLGAALSILKLIYTMSHLEIARVDEPNSNKVFLKVTGAATFISLPRLASALENLPGDCELHICLENVDYLDHACMELLMDWKDQHQSTGGVLVMDWGELEAAFKHKARRPRRHKAPHDTASMSLPSISVGAGMRMSDAEAS